MIRTQITLGIILMILTIGAMGYIFVTEEERMAVETEAQLARQIETGAQLFHTACASCHGENAEGTPGLCPPLNSLTLLQQRAAETGWAGSVHDYIVDTIRGGRLVSTRPDQYVGDSAQGMAMPFWSQDYGGPLRDDQIHNIAYFLENFGETDLEAAGEEEPVVEIPEDGEGLIEAGLQVYEAKGCVGCHTLDDVGATGAVGPSHNTMGTVAAERIEDPNYTGSAATAAEYIAESIRSPGAHVVDGYQNIMPPYPPSDAATTVSEEELEALVQMLLAQE
jgi:mono/diheme cytochrome c family protein